VISDRVKEKEEEDVGLGERMKGRKWADRL